VAGKVLVDSGQLHRTVARIAHEIVERHPDPKRLALVGIHTRGVPLAGRLARLIGEFAGAEPALGTVDIALYRDDVGLDGHRGALPVVGDTALDFDVAGRSVILVDDVLYTGRTIRAALDGIIDLGRPRALRLAVLVDRGHREFPIEANYVGKSVPTSSREVIKVMFQETDGADEVWILEKPAT
jgi:pyrimidine operon attenuation protein/uracil phosphoribosyltransferase